LRILLAEDHHINRKLCLLMLEEFGTTADIAENGVEVLAALAEKDYDLILMDCNMPELDGYQATKRIREIEASPLNVKQRRNYIIALTANALIGERERCLAVGMDDYLSKPFTASELRDALERSVGLKSQVAAIKPTTSRLDQLVAELDRESVAAMIQDYVRDIPLRIAEMEQLIAAAKTKDLERTAHSLKGVSATFGLDELSEEFSTIEDAAGLGDLEIAQRGLVRLKVLAEQAVASLQEWLAQKPA